MFLTTAFVKEMIEELNPAAYRKLVAKGQLVAYLRDSVERMRSDYETLAPNGSSPMTEAYAREKVIAQMREHVMAMWKEPTEAYARMIAMTATGQIETSPPVGVRGASDYLADALLDLDAVVDEASNEEFPLPSDSAVSEARRILHDIYHLSQRRFEVYPTPDGEIALDAHGDRRSVILLLDSSGAALCLVNIDGDHRRARYSSLKSLPDGFVREALADLDR